MTTDACSSNNSSSSLVILIACCSPVSLSKQKSFGVENFWVFMVCSCRRTRRRSSTELAETRTERLLSPRVLSSFSFNGELFQREAHDLLCLEDQTQLSGQPPSAHDTEKPHD